MRKRRAAAAFAVGVAASMATTLLAVVPAAAATPTIAAIPESGIGSATVVPIQVTGDPGKRFDLVIMGDGYTAADMGKFREQVDHHLNVMWSIEPYKSYRNYINVYAIEIVSKDSGIDCDPGLDSPRKDTPLDMGLWGGCKASGPQRLLTMSNSKAVEYANLVPGVTAANRQILALGNSDTYGGAGGSYATATGGNAMSALISPHEIGHSLGGLPDEYDYYQRGEAGGTYTGKEPSAADLTLLTEQQMKDQQKKWFRWLGEPSYSGGTIGRYEGGQYEQKGIWRPSLHSIMKNLGYYYDQVGLEVMTAAINKKVGLVESSTPTDKAIVPTSVVWVDTLHPNFHSLDITWAVDGTAVPGTNNASSLDLAKLTLASGKHTLTATVVDPTGFVRDPAIRTASMTKTLTWTIDPAAMITGSGAAVGITASTPNTAPVNAGERLFVQTTHPADRVLEVAWRLDGTAAAGSDGGTSFALADQQLSAGAHTVTATVTDPKKPAAQPVSKTWTVDNSGPQVTAAVSTPLRTSTGANGEPHYTVDEQFSLKLTATDDNDGYIVREFQLDGDGWFNYFGWPTDSEAPFLFTPTGTNIDDLIYGNLGSNGMSASPFVERKPGYGTHRIEYRGIDAAGNIGEVKAFTVTVLPVDQTGQQVITADVKAGALTMASTGSTVTMDKVAITGADQVTAGALNAVNVVDARGTAVAWSLTGQVSDFTAAQGTILAANLGWAPSAKITSGNSLPTTGDQAPVVTPGKQLVPGSGLSDAATLCKSDAGHNTGQFSCGAALALGVPGSARAGEYTAVLTLTLI